MPTPEKTCVRCGQLFILLPQKPGLVNTCPQCSAPTFEQEVIVRQSRQKRRKTTNKQVADTERWLGRRPRKISGKNRKDK
jgi:predicted  nucleic acid-binding Zn-ribbon protein